MKDIFLVLIYDDEISKLQKMVTLDFKYNNTIIFVLIFDFKNSRIQKLIIL